MAANFPGDVAEKYQGGDCSETSALSYCVAERRKLCESCATKKGFAIQARNEKIQWYCGEHKNKPIEVFCGIGCPKGPHLGCGTCGILAENMVTCAWEDVKKAISARKKEMEDYHCTLAQYKTNLDESLENSAKIMEDSDDHLTSVITDINALFNKEIEALKEKERTDKERINAQADAEVKEIEEARRAQLSQVQEEAARQREPFEKRRKEFTDRVTIITEEYRKNMTELFEQVPAISQSVQANMEKVEKLFEDDKDLLLKKDEIVRSVKEVIRAYSTNSTARERDSCSVLRVKFHKREKKSLLDGRLNGYYERWKHIDTYEIKYHACTVSILECLSDNVIVLRKRVDRSRKMNKRLSDCILELNLDSKEVHTVVEHEKPCRILSCSHLGDDNILCLMQDEEHQHKLVIYDRQWQFLRFINPSILDEPRLLNVYTQVDNDGMIFILANITGKDGICARIDLVDPVDGNTIKTHTLSGFYYSNIEFKVLSSGEIVCPQYNCIIVIDNLKSGAEVRKYNIHDSMSHRSMWTADTLIKVLYHGYFDDQNGQPRGFVVDQVFTDNVIKAKEIINIASWYSQDTSMVITPSGKLVLTNGYEIQVFAHSA